MRLALFLSALALIVPVPVASQPSHQALKPLPDDPAATDEDRRFIRRAYEIARSAVSHGNEPFGALLVRDGKILAEFENAVQTKNDVTKHAETGLISDACTRLSRKIFAGSTLYASTEPCTMCCGAIRWAGIERVVYGVSEIQVDRIIAGHFGDAPTRDPLSSKEVFRRIEPKTKIVGPVEEAEGVKAHAEFWPKFLDSRRKEE